MRGRITKIGNWNKAQAIIVNLSKDIKRSNTIFLTRWALKAEAIAKQHLTSQDLANGYWAPLAFYTINKKMMSGDSLDTLIETGEYLRSITSFVQKDVAYVGVRRTAVYKDGRTGIKQIANIARIQEYGSYTANIPARPLWQPTYTETMQWHVTHNKWLDIYLNIIRTKYGGGVF